ncbi:MAG TPA: alpha/beta hydrolase [Candidatus Acidoferrum sp.]|nr:alpha/beta hydrolase [Candidatus Acidoferrum sp.]
MTSRPGRALPLFAIVLLAASFAASAESRLVIIGSRKLSIDCDGPPSRSETVVLIAGLGRTAKDWEKVQPAVSRFARVCSYDLAGLGRSDKPPKPQTMDEIIDDLRALLKAAGEKPPYVLVGHSMAGIYSRRFVTRFPGDVAALLFVDSSHEEQFWRLHEIDPKGPAPNADLADILFIRHGQRLEWQTKLPLIVLAHGTFGKRPPNFAEEQFAAFDRVWRELQQDLATRSPRSQFRIAE